MVHNKLKSLWLVGFVWLFAGPALADNPPPPATQAPQNSLLEALTDGTPLLDMRYRYENVQQNGLSHEAAANTLRTRAGYETGTFDDFKARVQVENVMPFGTENYNDGTNGRTAYPTIADPRQTAELYEASMTWTGAPQSALTFGRQALALNNERWIGISDWRQLGQTMDAVTARNHTIPGLDLFYSYIFHVNRVGGPRTAAGTYDMHSHAINAAYTVIPDVKLIGYSYLLDISNAPTFSTATYGGRVEAKHAVTGTVNALFNGEYARQVNYDNNPASYGVDYYLVEPGVSIGRVTGKVGYEVLGGNGTQALQTPLASLHSFNGWADKFLTTPATGLDNVYVTAEYTTPDYNEWLNATTIKGLWYDYKADSTSMHYGNEYDAWIGQTFFKHYTLALIYADYQADQLLTDTRKIMVQLQIKY